MTDHIHIEKNHVPWQPSDESVLGEVFHQFTIPLVGITSQHGADFLFWCVVGHSGPENAWAYARLDRLEDARELSSADNSTFDEALRQLVRGRVCSFAVASDDGVIEWVEIEPPADFETTYERGMEELSQKVSEAMAEMESLMEQFPSLRRAGAFAISPSPAVL